MTQLEKPRTERFALTSVKSAKRLWGSQVWFQLLLVRPWLLVVGFWLVSVVVAVSALERIVKPKPLIAGKIEAGEAVGRAAPAEPSAAPPSVTPSFVTPSTRLALTDPDAASDPSAASALVTGVPLWSPLGLPIGLLSAMVGACAVGCVMLSRWRQLERTTLRARRSRSAPTPIQATGAQPAAVPAPAPFPAQAQFLVQSQAQSRRVQLSNSSDRKAGQSSGQKSCRRSDRQRRVARSARPAAAPRPPRSGQAQTSQVQTNREQQPVISVVPASEAHTLDWPEGSLAHQLDVRAKRSLSSFL